MRYYLAWAISYLLRNWKLVTTNFMAHQHRLRLSSLFPHLLLFISTTTWKLIYVEAFQTSSHLPSPYQSILSLLSFSRSQWEKRRAKTANDGDIKLSSFPSPHFTTINSLNIGDWIHQLFFCLPHLEIQDCLIYFSAFISTIWVSEHFQAIKLFTLREYESHQKDEFIIFDIRQIIFWDKVQSGSSENKEEDTKDKR